MKVQDRLNLIMVMLLKSVGETTDDLAKFLAVVFILSRGLSKLAESLEASFHLEMLSNVCVHEAGNACNLFDFWEVNSFFDDLMMMDEIVGDPAVAKEVGCLLCARNNVGRTLVD